ncbi:hypothetical protein HK105_208097 [Polyrhizophydium stewartii]|uniref:Blue (type 1) copper domain-containing protein n=1 Tax=Polyrhizophydium stewartii TaxID=2732419 RepID=A0ABR4MYS2_9FUNG
MLPATSHLAASLLTAASLRSAATIRVSTSGLSFVPPVVNAAVGDTIEWTFGGTHSVIRTASAASCAGNGGFDSGIKASGDKFTFTVTEPGMIQYACGIVTHCNSGMRGSIVVGASVPSISIPPVPSISIPPVPSVSMPSVPSVTLPSVPSISMPAMPGAATSAAAPSPTAKASTGAAGRPAAAGAAAGAVIAAAALLAM